MTVSLTMSLETGCREKTGREGHSESRTGLQGQTDGKGIVVYYVWKRCHWTPGEDESRKIREITNRDTVVDR